MKGTDRVLLRRARHAARRDLSDARRARRHPCLPRRQPALPDLLRTASRRSRYRDRIRQDPCRQRRAALGTGHAAASGACRRPRRGAGASRSHSKPGRQRAGPDRSWHVPFDVLRGPEGLTLEIATSDEAIDPDIGSIPRAAPSRASTPITGALRVPGISCAPRRVPSTQPAYDPTSRICATPRRSTSSYSRCLTKRSRPPRALTSRRFRSRPVPRPTAPARLWLGSPFIPDRSQTKDL